MSTYFYPGVQNIENVWYVISAVHQIFQLLSLLDYVS